MSANYGTCTTCFETLELCVGVFPWSIDHLICPKCDGTYNIGETAEWKDAPNIIPCPFCGSKDIGILEKKRKKMGVENKVTCCYCKQCGAKGPWDFSNDDTEEIVVQKCIERWNGRG